MIVKLILFACLVASPVLSSAIKGYREEAPAPAKGQRVLAPVEQQRILVEQQHQTKKLETITTSAEKKEELREEQQQIQLAHEPQQKLDDIKQERELLVQKSEELPAPPTKRYEAKSQVSVVRQEQELSKVQRVSTAEQTQQRIVEEAPKAPLEPQKPIEVERVEQVQRDTSSYDSQQVELHEEQQHRYEAAAAIEQRQQEEVQQVEEIQQVQYPVKGHQQAAPLGQAEPYAFEYQVEGSSRRESGDVNGVVRGQYTLQSSDGSSRIVDYVADANGFRASVNTNEFGTEARSPAGVELRSSQPEAQDISLRLEGKTRESLQAPAPPAPLAVKTSPQIPDNWRSTKGQAAAPLPAIVAQPVAIVVAAPAPVVEQPAEAPRAVLAPAPTKGQYPLKTHEPIIRAPAKGELDDKLQQQPQQQQQVELIGQAAGPAGQLETIDRRAPSAEYRAPKSLIRSAPIQPAQPGHFESATAHRNRAPVVYERRPVYLAAPPAVPIIARPVVAPVRTHLRQAPARGHYYQADRHYPSSSISAIPSVAYRRQPSSSSSSLVASGEQQPRSYSVDDDSLTASFDRSA